MYNFIDVTEVSESFVLPSEALSINGNYIENLVSGYRTLNVSGREALSPDVETYSIGIRDGSKVKSKRYPERRIIVRYQIKAESSEAFREAYNQLGRILDVEDAELIFNDEQDKFYVGTPCAISAVEPGTNAVVGEFEILCADPFKYSVIEYEAEPDLENKSVLLNYNGTYKGYPKLVAEFYEENETSEDGKTEVDLHGHGDCGYVAFFNENKKIIQLGDPDEADTEDGYPKSQTMISQKFQTLTSFEEAVSRRWFLNDDFDKDTYFTENNITLVGDVAIGAASYSEPETPAATSGTLLTATSKADKPNVKYTVTAKTTGRTEKAVNVTFSITAALTNPGSYWKNSGVLYVAVYVGGSWYRAILKNSYDRWKSTSAHTKSISATVTGLSASTNALTGIKFMAYRNDDLGQTGVLKETACKNLTISKYEAVKPETYYLTPVRYDTGAKLHGPSVTRTVGTDRVGEWDASHFTFSFSNKLSIGSGNKGTSQCGAFHVLLFRDRGNNRHVLAAVSINKSASGRNATMRFNVNGKTVGEAVNVDLSYDNKRFNASRTATIIKTEDTITFNIGGIKKTFRDSEIKDYKCSQIMFAFLQYGTTTPLEYNGVYWAKFVKHNCLTYKDIPNKFSTNDVVEADCETGEIYLNGVSSPSLGALGNDWEDFYLTPGLNQIGFAYSNWVTESFAPKIKVRYREVFL